MRSGDRHPHTRAGHPSRAPRSRAPTAGRAPQDIEPQRPTVAGDVPEGNDWLHEVEYDGCRLFAYLDAAGARLRDGHGIDRTRRYPRIAAALKSIANGRSMVIDGVVAAGNGNGFARSIADAIDGGPRRLAFFAFDLPWLDGKDLREHGLLRRKRRLQALLKGAKAPVVYSEHVSGDAGRDLYGEVVRAGGKGVVSKRKHAHYVGGPSATWLKVEPAAVKARQLDAFRRSADEVAHRRRAVATAAAVSSARRRPGRVRFPRGPNRERRPRTR